MEGVTPDKDEAEAVKAVLVNTLAATMALRVMEAGVGHAMYDNELVKQTFVNELLRCRDEGVRMRLDDVSNMNCKPLLAYQCQAAVAARAAQRQESQT